MYPSLEVLESRIAPAAVFTYTEADGDRVTIKTSAKINDTDFAAYLDGNALFVPGASGDHLVSLDLSDPVFRNSSLTITVKKAGLGDGLAQIGALSAGVDLKNVIINGDLESIQVGDNNLATPALSKLQVTSLGGEGAASYFTGDVNTIKITGDLTGDLYAGRTYFYEAEYSEFDAVSNIKTLNIGGSVKATETFTPYVEARRINSFIVGGDVEGEINADFFKSIRIKGSLVGGADEDSGSIYGEVIKSVRIGGNITGGSGTWSGGIYGENIGTVIVDGNISGGSGTWSGGIFADEELSKVIVLGSVIGGEGAISGTITGEDEVGSIRIDGSVFAGAGAVSGTVGSFYAYVFTEGDTQYVDEIYPEGNVDKIVIGGSVVGSNGGANSGSIVADRIGSLRIGGDVTGGSSSYSGSISGSSLGAAVIGGAIQGGEGANSASIAFEGIGNIRVVKSVTGGEGEGSASILARYGIGSIKIGGDLKGTASESGSIAAFEGPIDSIIIGGSLSNDLQDEGFTGIYAAGSIGRVTIGGGAIGGDYGTLGIRAGVDHPPHSSVPSIGTVSVKGNVENFTIEAGVGIFGGDVNYGATIGSVNITGNFIRSVIAAGVDSADGIYGNGNDVGGSDASAVSRIASVVIGGTAIGTAADLDSYGIFAQHIVALKVNGAKQTLSAGATNDLTAKLLSGTTDVKYSELPLTLPV